MAPLRPFQTAPPPLTVPFPLAQQIIAIAHKKRGEQHSALDSCCPGQRLMGVRSRERLVLLPRRQAAGLHSREDEPPHAANGPGWRAEGARQGEADSAGWPPAGSCSGPRATRDLLAWRFRPSRCHCPSALQIIQITTKLFSTKPRWGV